MITNVDQIMTRAWASWAEELFDSGMTSIDSFEEWLLVKYGVTHCSVDDGNSVIIDTYFSGLEEDITYFVLKYSV